MTEKSEEKLKEITIGDRKPHNSTIYLADYYPGWIDQFEIEKNKILGVLGDRALLIEHVGSTSVPGLIAKPIIDILLVVSDTTKEFLYVPDLESSDYILRIRESDWFEHRLFKGTKNNVNIHVFSLGCPEIDRMVLFRDYLRKNSSERDLYANTKRELSQKTWKYVQNYADAKSDVVSSIMNRAYAELSDSNAH